MKIEHAVNGVTAQAQGMIVDPLTGAGLAGLFSMHPPLAECARRPFAMAA